MSLDMSDHIDDTFESVPATRFARSGSRGSDGRWTEGAETPEAPPTHRVNLQPLSDREIQNLGDGAERLEDLRKIYINDGDLYSLSPQDEWEFDSPDLAGIRFSVYMMDNRPWRNYCKCVVHRNDR